ncbi:MAG: hypothetical protein QOH61_2739, partial [Chloroflexota bacterium]|nr:hypothetical protein [Chloroflexota bacterium]
MDVDSSAHEPLRLAVACSPRSAYNG